MSWEAVFLGLQTEVCSHGAITSAGKSQATLPPEGCRVSCPCGARLDMPWTLPDGGSLLGCSGSHCAVQTCAFTVLHTPNLLESGGHLPCLHTHTDTHTQGLYPGLYCCPYWCLSPSQDPPQTALAVEPCQLPEWEGIGLGLLPEGGTGAGRADWLRASLVQPRNNEPQPQVVFYGFSSHLATK